jgi:exportin-2 (importin alpha re-exporter)
MLRMPENLQKQLSDAITIIGKHDFPSKWMELFPKMSTTFLSSDFHAINGVLRTANPLFKR